jgi:antitoxin HicB
MKKKGRIGSSFDDFLKKEGIYEEVTARAITRVIARQLDALMQDQGLSKSSLAKRMKTSRAQLDRLLDPDNESVTLGTLTRAAQAVGRHLRMELVRVTKKHWPVKPFCFGFSPVCGYVVIQQISRSSRSRVK